MKLASSKITFPCVFTFCFLGIYVNAQETTPSISQDSKFEQLLNEKRKINNSLNLNEVYKVQIFSGDNQNARKIISEFKQEFKNIDATIVFNTPNYKVWVGNFSSRMETERNLIEIKKIYKNVFLIKPNL